MPTLINYNQSTFKNNVKPNKRRLQELQHSAARAHAARVAYWRRKGVDPTEGPSQQRKQSQDDDDADADADASSDSTSLVKQESDDAVETSSSQTSTFSSQVILAKRESPSVTDSSQHILQDIPTLSPSDSSLTRSHPISTPTSIPAKDKWRFSSETTSPYHGALTEQWDDLADLIKLNQHPKSELFDPFDSVPVRQDRQVAAAMDYFIHSWAPAQRPGLKYQTKDNPLIRDAFPAALQNVELFEATVALCLSFKAASESFHSQRCKPSLYHKGQALAGIRTKLNSGCVDEAVILATVFLMIIDNVFLDVDAYEAHLQGLRKMANAFKAAGSKELFGGALLSFIAWAESNALLLFGNHTTTHKSASEGVHLQYQTHPFPSTVTILIRTLTPGFQAVAWNGHLSLDVLSVLAKTVRWTRCIDPSPGQSPSESDQTFLVNFDPRANSAKFMRLCRVSDDEHVIERTVCKALYIYHANLLGWSCRCSGYRRAVDELGDALRFWVFRESWDRDLWTWLALMTANAARRGKLAYLQMEVMARFLTLDDPSHDWEYLQSVTKKFLFHRVLDHEWKICWDTAKAAMA